MALINCPECGRSNVSDLAKKCPGCGYPIKDIEISEDRVKDNSKLIIGIILVIVVIVFLAVAIISHNSGSKSTDRYYSSHSEYSNYSIGSSGKDASSIFRNLDIHDFSCSSGKYSGTMQCKVTNNNGFTVNGYFRVNFYDESGRLMYNQLMALPDVASGESVVCSSSIPKNDYPSGYSKVDFSQASLVDSD